MNLISKEIRRAEHEYMNIYPPPAINALVTPVWLMDLQEFDFVVKYGPDCVHNIVDALSRLLPCQQQCNNNISAEISAVTLCPDIS